MTGGQMDNGSTDADGREPEPVPTPAAGDGVAEHTFSGEPGPDDPVSLAPETGTSRSTGGEGPEPDSWRVHLSGGGVRATLCSAGALWQFRRMHQKSSISEIISVSGGSLTSAALLRDQPAADQMDDFVRQIHRRTKLNISNVASLIALAGTVGVLAGAAFADPSWLSDGWKSWVFTIAVAIWLISLAIVRVVIVTAIVLVVAVLTIEFDLSARWEGWAAAAVIGTVLVTIGVIALVRFVKVGGRGVAPPRRPSRTPVQWAGIFGTGALCILAMYLLVTSPIGAVVHWVLVIATAGVVSMVVGPLLLRGYLGRLVGDGWASERLVHAQQRDTTAPWCASHIVCTTNLRDEVPAFFVVDTRRRAGEAVLAPALVSDQIGDGLPLRAMGAARVRIVTMLQASAAAFPQFAPTIGFGIKTWKRPDPQQTERAPGLPLLADGGLRGTLGTQYTGPVEIEIDRLSETARRRLPYERTFVVDATRRRAPLFWWPVMLLPKLGSSLIQLRLVQAMLSALVDAERERLERGPGPVMIARATGDRFTESGTSSGDDDPFDELMSRLRRHVDRQTGWFPGRRKAALCIACGALAVIDADPSMSPCDPPLLPPTQAPRFAALRRFFGSWRRFRLRRSAVPQAPVIERSTRPISPKHAEALKAIGHIERILGVHLDLTVDGVAAPPTTEPAGERKIAKRGRSRRRWVFDTIRWVSVGVVVVLVLASNAIRDAPLLGGCEPVCDDDTPRHAAFGPEGFVAVSHQGLGGASNEITRQGFVGAYDLGFRHFETDIGLAPADRDSGDRALIAIHKKSFPDAEEAAGAPAIGDLLVDRDLAGAVWHLEINTSDDPIVEALADTISGADAADRVCVHFGNIISPSSLRKVTTALPADTCVCASVVERMRTADLPFARFLVQLGAGLADQFWVGGNGRERVDCSVVFQGSADARDVTDAGQNVVVMAWANGVGNETEEQLERLVCDGFGGIITNDPVLLADVLESTGVWNDQQQPTGNAPVGC